MELKEKIERMLGNGIPYMAICVGAHISEHDLGKVLESKPIAKLSTERLQKYCDNLKEHWGDQRETYRLEL